MIGLCPDGARMILLFYCYRHVAPTGHNGKSTDNISPVFFTWSQEAPLHDSIIENDL